MITKISASDMHTSLQSKTKAIKSLSKNNIQNTTKLSGGVDFANSIKAQKLSFKGNEKPLTELEKSFILQEEIRIPNILDINEPVHISRNQMPEGKTKLNAAGINLEKYQENGKDVYKITNDFNDTLFVGKFDRSQPLPVIIYKQGKYMPEITLKDDSLNGKKIKMFAGSRIQGKNFELIMPGDYEPIPDKDRHHIAPNLSFTGHIYTSVLNKEPRTKYAFDKWYNSDLPSQTIKGDYADEMAGYDPNIVLLMGGFGERFKNITRDKENKPSAKLPTNDNYRIMATTLNLAASAGVLGQGEKDSINYLSQAHQITGENVYNVKKYTDDGGAIAEGLLRDIIRNDKDTIILNGDIFTNADISRVYHALKTLPDAGLVIPYYPVDSTRARALGLLGIEKDENGNTQIREFIEKSPYTTNIPKPGDFAQAGDFDKAMDMYNKVQTARVPGEKERFLANPGLYFMSKEMAKILMIQGVVNPKETGLGKNVMPKIVEMANNGQILDAKGNPLKVYTVPLEAKGGKSAVWEDIGTAEMYLRVIKDVAAQTAAHGTSSENKYYGMPEFVLKDFQKNTDMQTGIVYGSDESRNAMNNFKQKYEAYTAYGNIFVTID